jgi:hypothetical protein
MLESARNFYARNRKPDALERRIQSLSLIRRPNVIPGQMSLQEAAQLSSEHGTHLRLVRERELLPLDFPPAA